MKLNKFIISLLLLFFLISTVSAVHVQISISEDTVVRELLNGQYSIDATGELEIFNPSNTSSVYEFTIPFSLDSLIGLSKTSLDNSSDKFSFEFEKIRGRFIEPNESIRVGYRIYGLVPFNIYDNLSSSNSSVFEYYSTDYSFLSQTIIGLQKPEREGFTFDVTGNMTGTPTANETARLVSVIIQNPTDFEYDLREVFLYRANAGDYGSATVSHFSEGTLLEVFTDNQIEPFGSKTLDYYDTTSFDNVVYWVSSDVSIKSNISTNVSRSFTVERRTGGGSGGGGSSSGVGAPSGTLTPEEIIDFLLIKKSTDKTIVTRGEEVTVSLMIVNVNNFSVSDLEISDFIPDGYVLVEASQDMRVSQGELKFSVQEIGAYETIVINYTLEKRNDLRGITFLNPAILSYDDEIIFSQGVILINEILDSQRVFIQKDVRYVDNDFARVTIRVKNLGSTEVSDLVVRENLPEDLLIREISQVLEERGVWRIDRLGAGEEWEVTYLVQRGDGIESLPSIFGVDQSSVFGTVIVSEEIVTRFSQSSSTNRIERIGLGIAIVLLIGFLLY